VAAGRNAGATQGVSPGRARGTVTHDPSDAAGRILVVDTLDPALASALPELAGLVSTTGSPLSHLAILAREYGVPAVIGVADATTTFADGDEVIVDGSVGEVERVGDGNAETGNTEAGDTQAGDTQAGDTEAGDTEAGDTEAGAAPAESGV
ncbi:PEP-utilizing enzyme, partial [Frankia sp. AiPs1]|uniref:PEP-utilizing enzyme n=1 Tax=Frankia sp. AiPs1 TaxID=573493 RepID=UPI0020448ACA